MAAIIFNSGIMPEIQATEKEGIIGNQESVEPRQAPFPGEISREKQGKCPPGTIDTGQFCQLIPPSDLADEGPCPPGEMRPPEGGKCFEPLDPPSCPPGSIGTFPNCDPCPPGVDAGPCYNPERSEESKKGE
jgi:hypothetical protein